MEAILALTPLGYLAIADGRLLLSEKLPGDTHKVAEEIFSLRRGVATDKLAVVLHKLRKLGVKSVIVDSRAAALAIRESGEIQVRIDEKAARAVKRDLTELAKVFGISSDRRKLVEFVSAVAVLETKMQISRELLSRDKLIVKAVHVLDTLLNVENAIVNQLREWYSLHFPELSGAISSHAGYVKLIASLKRRSSYSIKALTSLGFDANKAREIEKLARESIGPDIREEDLRPVVELARLWQSIRGYRNALEEYINETVKEIAPNTSTLAGPVIAARLISLAGGLDKLAKLPASTIQVLGASKALFRYLSGKGKPPKHGVIFRVKDVMSSPPKIRGKIARSLAAKLAIAARVDYYGGEYIGDDLLNELTERINRIKDEYRAQRKAARAVKRGVKRGKRHRP